MRIDEHALDLSAEEGARILALTLLSSASKAAERLVARADDEALHDFRVEVRRLRSTLRAFRPWLAGSIQRKHEKALRKAARSTNQARDAEVQVAWLAERRATLASERQRVACDVVIRRFEARGSGGHAPERLADRYLHLADRLQRRLRTYQRRIGGGAGTSFGGVLATLIGEQLEALVERMGAIRSPSGDLLHRARIEGKRLRYLLEPLQGNRTADANASIQRLKRLQDKLGELHDTDVLAAEVGDAFTDAAAEHARRVHRRVSEHPSTSGAALDPPRTGSRGGLLALARLVRQRRDALFAELEQEWGAQGMDALASEVRSVVARLETRAGGKLERERKYLLSGMPSRAAEAEAVEIAQGWLPGTRLRERIRRVRGPERERYWRALKQGVGLTRLEAEEETTRQVFEALWPLTEGRRVAKRRHRVREGSHVWEIDQFTDRDLVLAEIELPARATDLALPDWLGPLVVREVTDDPAFLNENLASTTGTPVAALTEAAAAQPGGAELAGPEPLPPR